MNSSETDDNDYFKLFLANEQTSNLCISSAFEDRGIQ